MKIIKCTCQHAYQDELYGKGNRCANETRTGQYRCTVCLTLHGSAALTQGKPAKVAEEPKAAAAKPAQVTKKEPDKPAADKKKKGSLKGGKR